MGSDEEAENLRRDDDDWEDELSRADQPGDQGSVSIVCQTIKKTTYPTVAGRYFACVPVEVSGAEVEGGAATFTLGSENATIFVLNLGSTIPPQGTRWLATFLNNRWVARYD